MAGALVTYEDSLLLQQEQSFRGKRMALRLTHLEMRLHHYRAKRLAYCYCYTVNARLLLGIALLIFI